MPKPAKSAIALLSGGLDSSVALAMARADGWTVPLALTFDYGQRAALREIEQAEKIAGHFGARHEVVGTPWFRRFAHAGGLVKGHAALPHPRLKDLSDARYGAGSAKAVWVPNRNGVLINVAAAFAEDAGAEALIVGFNREEAATFPDNSEAYLEAATKALSFSTANGVRVLSPTAALDKPAIVARAREIDFPFPLLWSCYEGERVMCGRCESCMRLKRALSTTGGRHGVSFVDASLS